MRTRLRAGKSCRWHCRSERAAPSGQAATSITERQSAVAHHMRLLQQMQP